MTYIGQFENDAYNGVGTKFTEDEVVSGIFKNDELVTKNSVTMSVIKKNKSLRTEYDEAGKEKKRQRLF